jgi:hypothetical protein
MEWQIIVALVIGIPIILFPVIYVWYLNVGGIVAAFRRARERRVVQEEGSLEQEVLQDIEYKTALTKALERYPWREQ